MSAWTAILLSAALNRRAGCGMVVGLRLAPPVGSSPPPGVDRGYRGPVGAALALGVDARPTGPPRRARAIRILHHVPDDCRGRGRRIHAIDSPVAACPQVQPSTLAPQSPPSHAASLGSRHRAGAGPHGGGLDAHVEHASHRAQTRRLALLRPGTIPRRPARRGAARNPEWRHAS